jgi:uncharacterized protein
MLKWYNYYPIMGVEFEFDPEKSSANKAKHRIDFIDAQAPWFDEALIEAPARTNDEPRFLVVGRIGGRHWSAVCVSAENGRGSSRFGGRARRIEAYESA